MQIGRHCCGIAAVCASMASCWSAIAAGAGGPLKLAPSDATGGDQFGFDVSVDGDTAIIGAPVADASAGLAYIFRWTGSGWIEEAALQASDRAPNDQFGIAVAIHGDTVIVGARLDDDAGTDSGSAYIFARIGGVWVEQAKLIGANGSTGDNFGEAVGIGPGAAIVGAALDDVGSQSSGSAYIFAPINGVWTQQAILNASDAAGGDQFGCSVAIDGGTAIIGAFGDDDAGADSGSAYIFTGAGSVWLEQAKIIAADGAAGDHFGEEVAIDGDSVIVSADRDDDGAQDSGSAYIFTRANAVWTQAAKLTAVDGASSDRFGRAVALDGDTAIVGATFADHAAPSAGSAYVFTASAGVWSLQATLVAPDGATGDWFANTVGIDGDVAFIGAALDDDAGSSSGSAYVFERIGAAWIGSDQKVIAADGAANDNLGTAVAISGDTAVVGARFDDDAGTSSGAAFVFTRTGIGWAQQAKLTAADAGAGDEFGISVAIDGDTVIVGANLDDGGGGAVSGSAYVFVRTGALWAQQAKLSASDGASFDAFGSSVAISGDTAIVGAPGTTSGAAYAFQRTGALWTQQAKLSAAGGLAGDQFGSAVAVDGNTALVGARNADNAANNSGAAFIFTRTGVVWTQRATLTASDAQEGDSFGVSAALEGDTALLGAYTDDDLGLTSGSAYVFTGAGGLWTQQAKLLASDGAAFDEFGRSVALRDGVALIGAPEDDDAGASSGGAYVFTSSGGAWTQRAKITAPTAALGDRFGGSVALDAGAAIVAARFADGPGGVDQGAAWVVAVAEESLPPFVQNLTSGAVDTSIVNAIDRAASGDRLSASPSTYFDIAPIDYLGRALSMTSRGAVRQPALNSVTLADGASFSAAAGDSMALYGQIDLPPGDAATLRAASLALGASAELNLFGASTLSAQTGPTSIRGALTGFPGADVAFAGPVGVGGALTLFSATFSGPSLEIDYGGRFVGDGLLSTSVTNRASFITIDSTLISGDLTNHAGAKVTVQIGTLTLLGSLINNGTIVGDLQTSLRAAQTQPGDGFSVGGDYRAGPEASLVMASDLWRITVGGDFDVAINDNTRYDMAQAELRIGAASSTDLERMSTDIGASPDGLSRTLPGHYPIGTLRITGNTANLVDNHDNDNLGQAQCEAVYVRHLQIDAGATLNTNGCPVYYETLTNNGSVDDPNNLIRIAGCPADFTGDGQVNGADLGLLLGSWGTAQADLTGDGNVDGADLGLLLGAWGPCL